MENPTESDGEKVSTHGWHLKTSPYLALTIVMALGLYLVVTSAFYPLNFLSVFDAKRLLQLCMFVALFLFAISYAPLRKASINQLGRIPKFISYAIFILFVIGITSSLQLSHPGYALVDVSMLFVMLLLVFITAGSRDLTGQLFDKWAVAFLAIMGFAVAVQEFMGFVVGWVIGTEFSYEQVLVHFANPRFYNQLQTWSIPVLAALPFLFPQTRRIRLICIIILGLQWFLVFSTGARGTFVSLITAMVFIAFWLPKNRQSWLNLQLSGAVVGIVFYLGTMFLNAQLIPQSGNFYSQSVGRSMMHTSGRSMLWRLSVNDAIRNPVLGTGPTRYACDQDSEIPAHPHSFLFRIMGEWGFIALALFFVLAITVGVNFLGNLKRQHGDSYRARAIDGPAKSPLQALLAISVLAGAMHACLSGLLIMPASQIAMILIAGWTLSLSGNSQLGRKIYPIAGIVLLCGLLLATAQLVFAFREIPRIPENAGFSERPARLSPRFWWVGRTCDYPYPKEEN